MARSLDPSTDMVMARDGREVKGAYPFLQQSRGGELISWIERATKKEGVKSKQNTCGR